MGGDHGVALSRANVYTTLKYTTSDSHHYILQFLGEVSIDLVCAMTSNDSLTSFSRCKTVREKDSYDQNCWTAAYADFRLQVEEACGESSSTTAPPRNAPPTPVSTPTAAPPAPEPSPGGRKDGGRKDGGQKDGGDGGQKDGGNKDGSKKDGGQKDS